MNSRKAGTLVCRGTQFAVHRVTTQYTGIDAQLLCKLILTLSHADT